MSADDLARTDAQPPKEIAPHILEELLDLRVSKRWRWPEITTYYNQLAGQYIEEGTLRQVMLREAPVRSVPAQVSYEVSRTIEEIWDSADADQPVFVAIYAKFIEWRLLNDQHKATALSGDGGEISQESLEHMDRLKNELARLLFDLTANSKDFSDSGAVLDQLATRSGPANEQDGSLTAEDIEALMDRKMAENKAMLEEIHLKHKLEVRGIYRPIRDSHDYTDEDDEL